MRASFRFKTTLFNSLMGIFSFSNIYAEPVDLTGTWSGLSSGVQSNCQDSALNHALQGNVAFNFDRINTNQFNIGLNHRDAGFPNETFNVNGQGNFQNDIDLVAANLTGTAATGELLEYSLTGQVRNDQIIFTGNGLNGSCDYRLNGSANRDIAFIFNQDNPKVIDEGINPKISGGSLITNNHVSLARAVIHTNSEIRGRIQNALSLNFRDLAGSFNQKNNKLAAGDGLANLSVWSSVDHSAFKNDFFRTKYDGDTNNLLIGVDYSINNHLVAGLAIGYEKTKIDTDFNLGKIDSYGISFSPYIGYLFNETWGMDIAAGYTRLKQDQYRLQGNTRIDSDVDSTRWFISANINGSWQLDAALLSVFGGIIHAENDDDAYTESNNNQVNRQKSTLTTLNIGGEVGYQLNDFEPFLSLTYNRDTTDSITLLTAGEQPDDDRDDFVFAVGTRYFNDNGFSLNATLSKRLGRKNNKENNVTISALWAF